MIPVSPPSSVTIASMAQGADAPPRRERNWDAYAAVIASFIGLLALMVAGYTAHLQRKQVRAQVWPRMELLRTTRHLSFTAANRGVGPARVRAVKVTVDGRPVKRWDEMLRAADIRYPADISQAQISGRVVSPGQELDIFKVADDDAGQKMYADVSHYLFNDGAKHRIGILLCYCSVLDECWVEARGQVDDRGADDHQVDRCSIPENERFRE
jgi:hypothetical protein